MTDQEIRAALKALDDSESVDLNIWEAGFMETVVFGRGKDLAAWPLSEKQRGKALEILEAHEVERRGEQEVVVKLPPGAEKHFKRR